MNPSPRSIVHVLAASLIFGTLAASARAQVFQQGKHLPAGSSADAQCGVSVSISGTVIAAGAPTESTLFANSGAVEIFERSAGGAYAHSVRLKAADAGASDSFGTAVSLDGSRVAVGAPHDDDVASDAGAIYIFERQSAGLWTQIQKLTVSNGVASNRLGVAVSLDGDRLVAGSTASNAGKGSVYVFERQTSGTWVQTVEIKAADGNNGDGFGVSISLEGTRLLIGSYRDDFTLGDEGSAYLYELQGSVWTFIQLLRPNDPFSTDLFGFSVDLRGDRALVGAYLEDPGFNGAGSAYMFERGANGVWSQIQKLNASDPSNFDNFGWSVALDDNAAIIGARGDAAPGAGSGSAYVFERSTSGTWVQTLKWVPSGAGGTTDDRFGTSADIHGGRIVVGAPNDDDLAGNAGSVALVSVWGDRHKIFGGGTPGCSGAQVVTANLPPEIDQPGFMLECSNVPPNSLGLGFVGNAQDVNGSDPFGLGVVLHVDFFLSTELIPLDFVSGPTGAGVVPAPIPNDPLIVSTVYYAQAVWAWSTCSLPPLQLSSSAGLQLVIMGI